MKTLVLSQSDLHELVVRIGVDRFMDDLIQELKTALATFDETRTEIPIRAGFHYQAPVTGLIEWMPLLDKPNNVLMKIVGYHPDSPDTLQVPTILSTLSKYDPNTGHLSALVDGTFLTAMRTGAASAVASSVLARSESTVLGLIGCGAQAVTQLHALSRVFDLRDVLIYDVDSAALATFPERVSVFADAALRIRSAPITEVVAAADILCTATSVAIGEGPVFRQQEMNPWVHINAVGSDFPGKIECPKALLEECFVCPDVVGQAVREGECQQLARSQIDADLVSVIQNADSYAGLQSKKTLFDSTGWALEDQVAMELLLGFVEQFSLGTEIQIESVTVDPRDPYEFLVQARKSSVLRNAR